MSLNRVTLIGHLGQDPELRHLPTSGQPVASFSVATDEAYTDKQGQRQERTDWHHIVVFGKAAESCKEYLKQGRQVYVEGRLRTREYEARNNGGKRQRSCIGRGSLLRDNQRAGRMARPEAMTEGCHEIS